MPEEDKEQLGNDRRERKSRFSLSMFKSEKKVDKYQITINLGLVMRPDDLRLHDVVAPEHVEAMVLASLKGLTYNVRETGYESIKRIQEGAKPKPHTILEKSIKPKSVKNGYPDNFEEIMAQIKELGLDGYVGHWDKDGKLLGLRMDDCPRHFEELCSMGEDVNGGTVPYLPVDLEPGKNGGEKLEQLKKLDDWKKVLYTGDYDLLELHQNSKLLKEGSPEKAHALSTINAEIAKVDPTRSGKFECSDHQIHIASGAYAMIQHGDQASYITNQIREAKVKGEDFAKVVQQVAEEDNGVIVTFHLGKIYLTENLDQLHELRDQLGIKTPSHWLKNENGKGKTTWTYGSGAAPKRPSISDHIRKMRTSSGSSAAPTGSNSGSGANDEPNADVRVISSYTGTESQGPLETRNDSAESLDIEPSPEERPSWQAQFSISAFLKRQIDPEIPPTSLSQSTETNPGLKTNPELDVKPSSRNSPKR